MFKVEPYLRFAMWLEISRRPCSVSGFTMCCLIAHVLIVPVKRSFLNLKVITSKVPFYESLSTPALCSSSDSCPPVGICYRIQECEPVLAHVFV